MKLIIIVSDSAVNDDLSC